MPYDTATRPSPSGRRPATNWMSSEGTRSERGRRKPSEIHSGRCGGAEASSTHLCVYTAPSSSDCF
eukprot:6975101-Pyramimonas_sp.AAC.1